MFLNGYPYTDFHEMNADFLLRTVQELKKGFAEFTASNSLIFAEPLLHDLTKTYANNTIVLDPDGNAYISLQNVPEGIQLSNSDYWLMVFNFEEYTEKANKNFTDNYFRDMERTPYALIVGDWVVLNDVLYEVVIDIPADGLFEIGTNIIHFTVEQFIKDFVASVTQTINDWHEQMVNTINQYKNDIDASEAAYHDEMQAEVDRILAGATVDSEVIDARLGADGVNYPTLGTAIRTQFTNASIRSDSISSAIRSIDKTIESGYDYSFNDVLIWTDDEIYNSGGAIITSAGTKRTTYKVTPEVVLLHIDYDVPMQMRVSRFNLDGTFNADFSWIKQLEIDTSSYNYFISLRKIDGTNVSDSDSMKCLMLSHPHVNLISYDVKATMSNYFASTNNLNTMGWKNSYIDSSTGVLVNSSSAIAESYYFQGSYVEINDSRYEYSLGEYASDTTFIRRLGWYIGGIILDPTKKYRISLRLRTGGNVSTDAKKYIKILSGDSTNISKYSGKKLSILGDSISTYDGYIPTTHTYYPNVNVPDVTRVQDTWWYKLMFALGMTLCVNNSYSGSCMSSGGTGTAPTGYSRATQLDNLPDVPDVIIIAMGVNDFLQDVPLGTYNGTGSFPTNENTFRSAYAMALANILGKYPYAEVYCATIMNCERYDAAGFPEKRNDALLEDFNAVIREMANLFGVKVLEHSKCGITYQNLEDYMGDWDSGTSQGLHPNEAGHSLMANNDIRQLDNIVRIVY